MNVTLCCKFARNKSKRFCGFSSFIQFKHNLNFRFFNMPVITVPRQVFYKICGINIMYFCNIPKARNIHKEVFKLFFSISNCSIKGAKCIEETKKYLSRTEL